MRGKQVAICTGAAVGVVGFGLGTVRVAWWHLIGARLHQMSQELEEHIQRQVDYIESFVEGQYEEAG